MYKRQPPKCIDNWINALAVQTCALSCPVTQNLYQKLSGYSDLSILIDWINSSPEVYEYLNNWCSTATIFAPNNCAFESWAASLGTSVEELKNYLASTQYGETQCNQLTATLWNHILPKIIFSAAYKPGCTVKVLNQIQDCLQVYKYSQSPYCLCVTSRSNSKAKVLNEDILALNGVAFIISNVLALPPVIVQE